MVSLRHRFEQVGGFDVLVRFALLSAIVVVGLGLVLGARLHAMVERAELDNITQTARFTVNFGMRGYLADATRTPVLEQRALAQLRRTVTQLRGDGTAQGIRLVSATANATIGDVPSFPEARADRAAALAGHDSARRVAGSYVITVPMMLPGRTKPSATVTVALPAQTIDATIARDARDLYLILVAGLATLWLVLLPVAARASRLLRREVAQKELLARTDALTGLPNRAWFGEQLDHLDAGGRIGTMVVDVDSFKWVNDTYGHHVGDEVLRTLADRLRSAVRAGDLLCRLGGDEFAVALPTDDQETLQRVADRIVELASAPIEVGGTLVSVAVSVGVALAVERDPDRLLREADDAMYRAKSAGGGRAELALANAA